MPIKSSIPSRIQSCQALINSAEHAAPEVFPQYAYNALMACKELLNTLDVETLQSPRLSIENYNKLYCEMITRVEHLMVNGRWVADGHVVYYEPLDDKGQPVERQISAFFVDPVEAQTIVQIIMLDIKWLRKFMGQIWDELHK